MTQKGMLEDGQELSNREEEGQRRKDEKETRREFLSKYRLQDEIGRGGYGIVYAAVRIEDGQRVAVKKVFKEERPTSTDPTPLEVALLEHLQDVPGVIDLIDYFDMKDGLIIVMERFGEIDLWDFITNQGPVPDHLGKSIFKQVVDTVILCLKKGVVHGDIKDENLLLNMDSMTVKMIDFGSGVFTKGEELKDFQGTDLYSPPEWKLHQSYTPEGSTVWALGILLHTLLCGDAPPGLDFLTTQDNPLQFSSLDLDPDARNLIQACLTVDPRQRISLTQIANNPWLSEAIGRNICKKNM